jgi:hypothetical protein
MSLETAESATRPTDWPGMSGGANVAERGHHRLLECTATVPRPSREIVGEIVAALRSPCYAHFVAFAGLSVMPEEGLEPPTRGL